MGQSFSNPTSMSDRQLISTIRMEMSDIESNLRISVNTAKRQVSAAMDSVSIAEKNVPNPNDMLSGCSSIGGCGCFIFFFCGFLNSCGFITASTFDNTMYLYLAICAIIVVVVILLARKPAIKAQELRDSKNTLANVEQRLSEARELRNSIDEVCTLMESTRPGEMLHDIYRGRLEGLLEDVRNMHGQLQG